MHEASNPSEMYDHQAGVESPNWSPRQHVEKAPSLKNSLAGITPQKISFQDGSAAPGADPTQADSLLLQQNQSSQKSLKVELQPVATGDSQKSIDPRVANPEHLNSSYQVNENGSHRFEDVGVAQPQSLNHSETHIDVLNPTPSSPSESQRHADLTSEKNVNFSKQSKPEDLLADSQPKDIRQSERAMSAQAGS